MITIKTLAAALSCLLLCSCISVSSMNGLKTPDARVAKPCKCSGDSIKSELYFGLRKPDGTDVTEAEWQVFSDKSISSRFPDGFTVLDACGQYKDSKGRIIKEKTRVLVIVHKDDKKNELDKICDEYKKAFSQESVLRTSSRVSNE